MRSAADRRRLRGGPLGAPATIALAATLVVVYLGLQSGQFTLGISRSVEFRCNAVEYGLIPYEATHPGERLTDPYCEPQPGDEERRTDPGMAADAPTWLTPLTSVFMHGGGLHLAVSVVFLLALGPRVERRVGAPRLLLLFLLGGLAGGAAVVALAPFLPIATIGASAAVAALIGAQRPALAVVAAWIVAQVALADLDLAQPVAGAGGDVAYLAPLAGLMLGLATRPRARASAQHAVGDVRDERGAAHRERFERMVADAVEDPLPRAEQDRGDVQPQLVDVPGREVLAHRPGAARDRD